MESRKLKDCYSKRFVNCDRHIFKDLNTDCYYEDNAKSIYKLFHNQTVTQTSILPNGKVLFVGYDGFPES